jgi:hypothetical protein
MWIVGCGWQLSVWYARHGRDHGGASNCGEVDEADDWGWGVSRLVWRVGNGR